MYFLKQYGAAGDMYSLNTTFSLFNYVLHQESFVVGEALVNFWSRSDSKWPTDRRICQKLIFAHKFALN